MQFLIVGLSDIIKAKKINFFSPYLTEEFPIWWYVAPTIINTFLEQYDLTGKQIIPLATSGGSSMGNTRQELALSCLGAVLKEGTVFSAHTGEAELKAWAEHIMN